MDIIWLNQTGNNNWYIAHGVKDFQLENRLCG